MDDDTVAATGTLTEALEWVERARGRLYDFHQMIGHADALLGEATNTLEERGIRSSRSGSAPRPSDATCSPGAGPWQVAHEFDDRYYATVSGLAAAVRRELLKGRRHVFEAELKDERRTSGRPGHERRARP